MESNSRCYTKFVSENRNFDTLPTYMQIFTGNNTVSEAERVLPPVMDFGKRQSIPVDPSI
jgi:hypothetical protein